MRSTSTFKWFVLVVVVAVFVAFPLPFSGQETVPRRDVIPTSLPAIDGGLRADSGGPDRANVLSADVALIDGNASPERFVPGRVIVKFRNGVAGAERNAVYSLASARSADVLDYANFAVLTIDPTADPERVAEALSLDANVEYAQASYLRSTLSGPNDPLFAQQWNLAALNMERAWDINPGASSSVVVAVIDSGMAFRNVLIPFDTIAFRMGSAVYRSLGRINVPFAAAPELGGADRFVTPFDFVWNDDQPIDMDGHGTHVAGTIGQLTNNGLGVAGIAFNVRFMPIKVVPNVWDFVFSAGRIQCCGASDDTIARAIRYAVANGANVINLSIGGPSGAISPVLDDALRFAVSRNVFVAIAAGNDFEEGNPIIQPAALGPRIDGVMTVGAVGRSRRRARYSSTGSYVEIAAPGGDQRADGASGGILQQTVDQGFADTYSRGPALYRAPRFDVMVYDFYQGTSMAAPHVTGLAALLITQGITKPAAIEAAIKRFATDLGQPGRDDEYGYGLIDARAALRGLGVAW